MPSRGCKQNISYVEPWSDEEEELDEFDKFIKSNAAATRRGLKH